VLLIVFLLLTRQGANNQVAQENAIIQATNEAVIALSQITPTPLPTNTPMPTNTAAPTNTPAPTATPAPKDLVDTALSAGNFKTLSSLLQTAGLIDTLKGQGPYTIFAPTDDAFAQLSPESLDALKKDPQKLAALLKYHVVAGAMKAADVAQLTEAKTLEGDAVTITAKNDKTQINDATVTKSDLATANGVIQTIDRVLVPPALRKEVIVLAPPTPQAAAQATTAPAGKGTAIAQVQPTAVVPTRVPPQAATATAAASKNVTSTQPISGTTGTGTSGLPTTGANDNLFMLLLAAVGLVGVLVVARRLRTS
jgi:LPXTG-motif cell wall-anchored protein